MTIWQSNVKGIEKVVIAIGEIQLGIQWTADQDLLNSAVQGYSCGLNMQDQAH